MDLRITKSILSLHDQPYVKEFHVTLSAAYAFHLETELIFSFKKLHAAK
jgi:hypothetical protein